MGSDEVIAKLKKEKFDVILDSIGAAFFPKHFDVLKPNGNLVRGCERPMTSGARHRNPVISVCFASS